ncbi:Adenylate cyclase 1 [Symmachiella macrocystis]|uniref:Adenylate cyclase 1 n=1 Tax=Symmachiella macrocystis TaxID=2527985 RepID=A0A5C6BRF8_9PLAN|nr:adenylate/guanylate cyclase domain-containing protein [Symmachiella macrocystis]TWU14823.1 Adenylate cyclase 1 [Symmachiella macrocystis]
MAELTAECAESQNRTTVVIKPDKPLAVGRDEQCDLAVPWDKSISRKHVEVHLVGDSLRVRRFAVAANPLFHRGAQVESCELEPGEHFVLGQTAFLFSDARTPRPSTPTQPVEEVAFSRDDLRRIQFLDADRRIEVLTHLPDVIWGARTDEELFVRLTTTLLAGIAGAEAAAVVSITGDDPPVIEHWERRLEVAGEFRPSTRLIRAAVLEKEQSILHVWESEEHHQADYTITQEFDWAFCTPVRGAATQGWGLYLAGRFDRAANPAGQIDTSEQQLRGDVKFAELMAEIISAVRQVNRLERQQAGLRQFFAPRILSSLGDGFDTKSLDPRECDVTVLFCDLRGFSKQAEGARDELIHLLDRVSQALGVMTHHISEHGGVIGDYQGDAAMGFWGWPVATDSAALDACRAALGIRAAFAATAGKKDHALADFQMGIGIAHGRAVAGKIGTTNHVKVTVFGPVVNLASRLEGMTKQLRVPILLDEALVDRIQDELTPEEGRIRKLARVLPYGMQTPVTVSELLPPEAAFPELTAAHLASYEHAVTNFLAGDWEQSYRALHDIPPSDRAQDFLNVLIAQHNRQAPGDWDGIVKLPSK